MSRLNALRSVLMLSVGFVTHHAIEQANARAWLDAHARAEKLEEPDFTVTYVAERQGGVTSFQLSEG